MHEDLEARLRAAAGSIDPSKRPARERARAAALAVIDARAPSPEPRGRTSLRSFGKPMARRVGLVAATLAVVAAVAIVAAGDLLDGEPVSPPVGNGGLGAVAPNADFSVPVEDLEDVVSYADHLAVVSIVDERALAPPRGADPATDADYVARELTVDVERRLWRRAGARPVPDRIDMVAFGWIERDGDRMPFVMRGSERLEVGRHYLMPLVYMNGEWGPYPVSTLRLDGQRTATDVNGGPVPPTVSELAGRPLDEVVQTVGATEPDPLALRYSHLPPAKRWQAADADRNSPGRDGGR